MSTDSTQEQEDSTDEYAVEDLRRMVPSRLGDKGRRAVVCAIRNPDANAAQIARKCGFTSSYVVSNALRSLLRDPPDQAATGKQMHERRGGVRDAESYAELTEKQQAVVDFAARHGEFVEAHTYAEVADAIQEQQGTSVSETHVGGVLRKYREVLHQRRAQVAAEDGDREALEEAAGHLTVREVLEAAGYTLPDENLDQMPEYEGSRQATLGEVEDAEADDSFETAAEVQEGQEQDDDSEADSGDEGPPANWLSDEWVAYWRERGVPGAEQASRLPDEAEDEDVKGGPYWAYVNGVAPYGAFVSLTNPVYGDDVSGLVHSDRLYGTKDSLERGDPLVVVLDHQNPSGLAFTDWRIARPDEAEAAKQREAEREAEQEDATTAGEGGGGADDASEAEAPDEGEATPEVVLPEDLMQRLERLETGVDLLRENAVMAMEVREFASQVEDRLDDLHDVALDAEERAFQPDEEARATAETAQQDVLAMEDRLDTLQEMVQRLGQQVQQATAPAGPLGRVQEDVQRLAGEGATVASYSYQRQDGTVTLHVQADVGEQEAAKPECHHCGAPLGETWQEQQEAAREDGTHPAECPQCGENPLPPVGSGRRVRVQKENQDSE